VREQARILVELLRLLGPNLAREQHDRVALGHVVTDRDALAGCEVDERQRLLGRNVQEREIADGIDVDNLDRRVLRRRVEPRKADHLDVVGVLDHVPVGDHVAVRIDHEAEPATGVGHDHPDRAGRPLSHGRGVE
jgi:hypothetical protein